MTLHWLFHGLGVDQPSQCNCYHQITTDDYGGHIHQIIINSHGILPLESGQQSDSVTWQSFGCSSILAIIVIIISWVSGISGR